MTPFKYFFIPIIGIFAIIEAVLLGMDVNDNRIFLGVIAQSIYISCVITVVIFLGIKLITYLFI